MEAYANRSNVAALIPAYREQDYICDVAKRTLAQLDHVLVVNDGSPDATEQRAKESGAEVITHEVNRGKGAAIKTGLKALTGRGFKYVQILDGDGQHLPEEIPRFLDEGSRTQAHIIVGNRMSDVEKMPFVRKMTNRFMSWQIGSVCGQPIPDTQCGFRMIHRDVAPLLFCESDAFDYETEMLLIASKAGFKIGSVPVSTIYGTEKSKIHPVRDTIKFFKLMSRHRKK
jgi:glycosyltransferase involved in cell wall biosynthesis